MKRQILFPIAMLALAMSQAAQAQDDGGFCANVTQLTKAAKEARPFGSVLGAGDAPKLKPVEDFRDCRYIAGDFPKYTCFLSLPEEQMEVLHEGLGAMLSECLGVKPQVEQVEPALLATGKLPYLRYSVDNDAVRVALRPRQDWGEYADDAWDEEFTDFGFEVELTRF